MPVQLLLAQADGGSPMSFLMLLAIPVIFWYMIYVPSKKSQQERTDLLGKIRKHDKVLTSGGIWGTVVSVKDNELILRIDEDNNVRVRFVKTAVVKVESSGREGAREEGAEAGAASEKKS